MEPRSANEVPRMIATTLAWTNRSASLPKPSPLFQDDGHVRHQSKTSNRIMQQRVGKAVSGGDSTASTRLDRVGNLETLIRTRVLSKFNGDFEKARNYMMEYLNKVSTLTESSQSGTLTQSDDSRKFNNSTNLSSSTSKKKIIDSNFKQKELLNFIETIKTLSGRNWKTTAHISDIEFMFNTLLKRDMNRFIQRLFPPNLMLTMTSNTINKSSRISVNVTSTSNDSSGHVKHRDIDVFEGPFNDLMIRKSRAISGVKRDDVAKIKNNVTFRGSDDDDEYLVENKSESNDDEESNSMEKGPNEHFLVRYRQSNSLIPVPSWWRKKGNLEYLAQRSSSKAPSIAIEPLYVWCGAGRVDGRAIPIVTQVLQSSTFSREQIYVSGCLIVTEKPKSSCMLRYHQDKRNKRFAQIKNEEALNRKSPNSREGNVIPEEPAVTINADTMEKENVTINADTMLNDQDNADNAATNYSSTVSSSIDSDILGKGIELPPFESGTFVNKRENTMSGGLSSSAPTSSSTLLQSQPQRRFRGHLHQVTAFAISPCGKYVASASIGSGVESSVLLAWNIKNGKPIEKRDMKKDEFIVDEEKEPMKAAVAKAGGDCLIALGVFAFGVACIAWSKDSSQIVVTSRDWKNTISCYHVRKNGSNFDMIMPRPVELFSQPTMNELAPTIRCVQWFGEGKFASFGEKGHFAIWSFKFNPLCLGADRDIPKVFLKTRNGSAVQSDGERAVTQCAVVIHATIPKYLISAWKKVKGDKSESNKLPTSASQTKDDNIEGLGDKQKDKTQEHGHDTFVTMIVSGSTAGSLYFLDPDNEPTKGQEKSYPAH